MRSLTLSARPEDVRAYFSLAGLPDLAPRYNVAPTQLVAVVGQKPDGRSRGLVMLRWGLVPAWSNDPLGPETWLSTGSEGMVYRPGNPVDVWKPDGRWPGDLNPLATGLSEAHLHETPDALVARPGGCQLSADDLPANDGRPAVGVRFVIQIGPSSQAVRMALDPARGHLPCRAVLSETSTGGSEPAFSVWEFWLLDARDCGRGRFFPTRYVFFAHPAGEERGYQLFDLAVTELDPDHAPTREDLSVALPAGTGLYLHRQPKGASLTLGRGTTLHVDDLPVVVADLEAWLPPARDPAALRGLASRW